MVSHAPGVQARRRGEAGYSMIILVILITVMTILMGMALPYWSNWIQREKEEELIFRGLQYAEAIRVFRTRFGRAPSRLEELIEVKPRSIRKLWEDPMTDDGKWGILFEGAPGTGSGGRLEGGPNAGRNLVAVPQGEGTVTVGPIAGVYSRSTEKSFKVFLGAQQYDQWRFTYQILASTAGTAAPGSGNVSSYGLKAQWIGRPFREGVTLPGTLPGGTGVDGQPVLGSDGRPVGSQTGSGRDPTKPPE